MALEFKTIQPLEYYKKYFEHKIRPDGRRLMEFRPTTINIGSIENAEGSAIVRFGNTAIVCGIKLELAPPKEEAPRKGFIVPNIELSSLCAPHFKPGPPCEQAQVASQLIAKIVENSRCINLEDLCIKEEKLVWVLYCDMVCLNYDGNVIDPALIAMFAALQNVSLPKVTFDPDGNQPKVDPTVKTPLRLHSNPVATTFALFEEDTILADPVYEEECLALGIVNVVTLENGQLCEIYKPGGVGKENAILEKCIHQACQRGDHVRQLVRKVLSSMDKQ